MQKSTKSERQMLREIVWLWGSQHLCFFCNKPLLLREQGMTFGHRRHGPITAKLTVHHKDHNRENNKDENLALAHTICHKRYHAEVNSGKRDRPTSLPTNQ